MFYLVLKHLLPFFLGIFIGTAAFYLVTPADEPQPVDTGIGSGWGSGSGAGSGASCPMASRAGRSHYDSVSDVQAMKILSKPAARYTDAARDKGTEGAVRLKVTLLADGKVGSIVPLTQLPDGLTERAIDAARSIEFEPKRVSGVAVPVTVTIEYTFSIY